MNPDPLHHAENLAKESNIYMGKVTKNAFKKYPITFSLLVLFGVTSVMHGYDALIKEIPLFDQHPILLFFIGLVILILTGSLYKRLNKKLE